MYLTLGIIFLVMVWALTVLGQKTSPMESERDALKRHLELREEIHKRMMGKLLHGIGPDEDLFKDLEQLMDDSMKDSFSHFDSFTESKNFESQWVDSEEGKTLEITPQNKDQRLDINVENGLVTIKGKNEIKTAHGTSISSFSNSFSVPLECDASKVKMDQKGEKILVFFPYKNGLPRGSKPSEKSPPKSERVPIPVPDGALEI